jgi:hypothetical protein
MPLAMFDQKRVSMNSRASLLFALAFTAFPGVVLAQFVDTFSTIDPAWVFNRYAPAGFTSVIVNGDSRLQLTIDQSGSTANRGPTFVDPLFNTQGDQRPGGITGLWTLSAQVYVSSAFDTTTGPLVQSDLWGHTGTTSAGGAYMILGFTNSSPTHTLDAAAGDRSFRFQAFDPYTGPNGTWIDLGLPAGFVFDSWHMLSGTSTGTSFEYRIDGVLVQTIATTAGNDLLSAMIQGYNFSQAGSYSVYWDNVTASAIPEPATYAALAGLAALGLTCWRRRRTGN